MDSISDPDNNITGLSYIKKSVIRGDDWQSAKKGIDVDAGNRVVDQLWPDEKTDLLKNLVPDNLDAVFLTTPSSSGKNIIPISFAEKLSDKTGIPYELGEKYFYALHNIEIKLVSRSQRPFYERDFELKDKTEFDAKFNGKSVIIVEDVLTTGGTVRSFRDALNQNGVTPTSVVALMGDGRLKVDEKTIERLSTSLQKAGLNFDAGNIAKQLTRTETGIVIMSVNSARSENAKRKLAENLQRVLDRGAVKNMGRDREADGNEGPQRSYNGNEAISGGIQTRIVLENRGDKEKPVGLNKESGIEKIGESKIEPVINNREAVRAAIGKAQSVNNSRYLESRGISASTINNPRFVGMIRQDDHKNVLFPHRDREGLSGAEIGNKDFAGFTKGGLKAIWHSKATPEDKKLVITISGLEALSYHQIKGDQHTRYLSVGGEMNASQEEIVKAAIKKMPRGSEIIAGFNKDLQGEHFTEKLKSLAPQANIKREVPGIGKAWNEHLQVMLKNQTLAKGLERELLR
jgi:hypothetical protein